MAASITQTRERVTFVGEESTFNTTPSGSWPNTMDAFLTTHDTVDVDGLAVEQLDVNDERVRRDFAIQPVQGLEIGSKVTFGALLKSVPTASQVTGSTIAHLSHRKLYRHHFGAEGVSYGTTSVGTTIAGATTITGQAGWGAHVVVGSWLGIVCSDGLELRKVLSVATDTVTLHAPLVGTTANAAIIKGLHTYCPAEAHSLTLAFQRAFVGDANAQYTLNGCAGSLKVSLPRGKLGTLAMDLMVTSFVGPSPQALSTAAQTDDMGSPLLVKGPLYITPASAPVMSASTPWVSVEVVHQNHWQQVFDGSQAQTVGSMRNTAGRPRAASFKCRVQYDATNSSGWEAQFVGQSGTSVMLLVVSGTGATAQVWGVEFPNAVLVAKPKPVKDGEFTYMDIEFNALPDTTIGAVSATPQLGTHADFANATVRTFFG